MYHKEEKMQLYSNEYLENIITDTQQVACALYQNDLESAQLKIGVVLEAANNIYRIMAENAAVYQNAGIEIPLQVLRAQLANLSDAVENQDFLALADILQYELREGLLFYRNIKGIIKDE